MSKQQTSRQQLKLQTDCRMLPVLRSTWLNFLARVLRTPAACELLKGSGSLLAGHGLSFKLCNLGAQRLAQADSQQKPQSLCKLNTPLELSKGGQAQASSWPLGLIWLQAGGPAALTAWR